jgi:hypothetical protein
MAIIAATSVRVFQAGKPRSVDLVLPLRVLDRFAHQMNDGKDNQFRRDRQNHPDPKNLLPKSQYQIGSIRIKLS